MTRPALPIGVLETPGVAPCGHLHSEAWPDCTGRPRCPDCGRFLRLRPVYAVGAEPAWHVAWDGYAGGWEATCQ